MLQNCKCPQYEQNSIDRLSSEVCNGIISYLLIMIETFTLMFFFQDHFLFCSGAYDGKVNLYSAQRYEFLQMYNVSAVFIFVKMHTKISVIQRQYMYMYFAIQNVIVIHPYLNKKGNIKLFWGGEKGNLF